jgi:diguanylate cyclase (GGDEF)-like protein
VTKSAHTIDALTALATASTAGEAIDALRIAREALGPHAGEYESLLMSMAARASEVHRLKRLAGRDALTGAANRRAFEEALGRELARHGRTGEGLAVVLLDLDGLKALNDTHGHAAGDQAIMCVARACESALRTTDIVARLGGDEFALLLPGVDVQGAAVAAERARSAVENSIVAGQRLEISVGVAVVERGTAMGEDELLATADTCLYADKRARKHAAKSRAA